MVTRGKSGGCGGRIDWEFGIDMYALLHLRQITRDFPGAQWLRLCAPNTGGPGLIPGQGTRARMTQLRACMPQLKILHAAMKILRVTTKTRHSQKVK